MNEEKVLSDFRKSMAAQLERDAVILDAHAEQWESMSKKFGRADLMATAAERLDEAKKKRTSADKLHALVGIDPSAYSEQIAKVLRIQAQANAQDLVVLREKAAHPDIYGGDPESLQFDVEANEALVDALNTRANALENEVAKRNPDNDSTE